MSDVKWFALMVCVGLICFFGFLSVNSISIGLTNFSNKSSDWKEIAIQFNQSMDKVIEVQRLQSKGDIDVNVMNERVGVNPGKQ